MTAYASDGPPSAHVAESVASAVSWPAIIAGTFISLVISVVLAILGSGFGFATAFNSDNTDMTSLKNMSLMYVVWIIIVQWAASALGGYMTGRLRTRWVNLHTHEVFFRDTAHGFLTWALATLIAISMFSAGASSLGTGAAIAAAAHTAPTTKSDMTAGAKLLAYDVDNLFRPNIAGITAPAPGANAETRDEAGRILLRGLMKDGVPDADQAYLAQLVSTSTGISPAEAQSRVTEVVNREQDEKKRLQDMATDAAKMTAKLAIYVTLSLLVGAFIASISAATGGRTRDRFV